MSSNAIRSVILFTVIAIAVVLTVVGFIRGFNLELLLAWIASSAAAAVAIYFFVPSITEDELELDVAMKKLGGGEPPDKLRLVAIGELADLKHSFNEMTKQVGDRLRSLERENGKLELMMDNVADAIFVVNRYSEITMVNNTALRMFNLEPSVVGRTFIDAVRDHEFDALVKTCLASGSRQHGSIEIRPDRRFFEVTVTPPKNEPGAVVVARDLTEIKRLERVRRDFVANISHELRTPLASLKLLAETLRGGAIDDPAVAADFLNRIEVETDKLTQMVRELGELSRIESGEAPLSKKPMDLGSFINKVAERMRPQSDRAELALSVEVAPGLRPVPADADRIEQVLVNLLHNAIKFTSPGGRIIVSANPKNGNAVEIAVKDTGMGISAEDLPRIFERFYKADKARGGGGTGLGLAIAKHIVKAHGGDIRAESVPGQGSTFYFTLPR
ncbi:two-component system, OmpR family, phosphate regulon sensor histidine kinase PhoR [Dehalogenimonas formicexedens]|uniref:histidine kinase n=1 Tax=Dehalogenimonas formicexedens TaxID=1839801 RepID=A0A1P8F8Y9_9CHLR|nr:ATP-binding protein [Dehalogenimonas formicexedens]APV44941.1 two-component system, OmpR family, phosphate regulon sensor histidine kinase PhoR [Dehalogenimonas formicexedens]